MTTDHLSLSLDLAASLRWLDKRLEFDLKQNLTAETRFLELRRG